MEGGSHRRAGGRSLAVACAALASLGALAESGAQAGPSGRLTLQARISSAGVGPIKIGMTETRAEKVSGGKIDVQRDITRGCSIGRLHPARYGVSFLLTGPRIEVIYVTKRGIATRSGVRVGDTIARLRGAYGSQLVAKPNFYHAADTDFEIADGNRKVKFRGKGSTAKITSIETGRKPEVDYVEGCA